MFKNYQNLLVLVLQENTVNDDEDNRSRLKSVISTVSIDLIDSNQLLIKTKTNSKQSIQKQQNIFKPQVCFKKYVATIILFNVYLKLKCYIILLFRNLKIITFHHKYY